MHDLFKQQLHLWRSQGLWRERKSISSPQQPLLSLNNQEYLSFTSNDYLGFAQHPVIKQAMQEGLNYQSAGSGSSAMVSGHSEVFDRVEHKFASLLGHQQALHFSTGYMANLGVISAITLEDTALFSDELNHASLIDGIRLAKPSQLTIYKHVDLQALEEALKASPHKNKWIITDGVFSMDGDLAPVKELLELCEKYNAYLYIDDAHGFGVLGDTGKGILEYYGLNSPRILYMATLGKAMGVFGALVSGDQVLINWILQKSRTYMFTTGSPPILASGIMAALTLLENDQSHVRKLQDLINYLANHLAALLPNYTRSITAIHPIIIGTNDKVMQCMDALLQESIWVPGIRPPTVPLNTARLRISLSAAHERDQLDRLLAVLSKVL